MPPNVEARSKPLGDARRVRRVRRVARAPAALRRDRPQAKDEPVRARSVGGLDTRADVAAARERRLFLEARPTDDTRRLARAAWLQPCPDGIHDLRAPHGDLTRIVGTDDCCRARCGLANEKRHAGVAAHKLYDPAGDLDEQRRPARARRRRPVHSSRDAKVPPLEERILVVQHSPTDRDGFAEVRAHCGAVARRAHGHLAIPAQGHSGAPGGENVERRHVPGQHRRVTVDRQRRHHAEHGVVDEREGSRSKGAGIAPQRPSEWCRRIDRGGSTDGCRAVSRRAVSRRAVSRRAVSRRAVSRRASSEPHHSCPSPHGSKDQLPPRFEGRPSERPCVHRHRRELDADIQPGIGQPGIHSASLGASVALFAYTRSQHPPSP